MARERIIVTERDGLAFALGILAALVADERAEQAPLGVRRMGVEAYDALQDRARSIGIDLGGVDEKFEAARAALLDVDDGDSTAVPSGDSK